MRFNSILSLVCGLAVLFGCGSSGLRLPGQGGEEALPARVAVDRKDVPDLELRALLLLLSDRKLFEPLTVERSLEGSEGLRQQLALSLGRIPSRRSVPVLKGLLLDPSPEVRKAAAFSLGLLEAADAVDLLLRIAAQEDREVGEGAVEALARIGVPVIDVGEALTELSQDEFWWRLLPSLYRFEGEGVAPLALLGLERTEAPMLKAWAAYALAEIGSPATEDALRQLLSDEDPWVRGQGVRGLSRLESFVDLAALRPLLEDPDGNLVVLALRLARQRLASGVVAPPDAWREPLGALLQDARPGVRLTAVDAAGEWLLDPDLEVPLLDLAQRDEGVFSATALRSLALAGHPRAPELVAAAVASSQDEVRLGAVEPAAILGLWSLVEVLAGDEGPSVRERVLEVRLAGLEDGGQGQLELVSQALAEEDIGIRRSALDWLTKNPVLPVEDLARATARARRDRVPQTRLLAVRALVTRAQRAPSEEKKVLEVLLDLASADDYLLRREATQSIEALGFRPPEVGPVQTRRTVALYEQMVLQSIRHRKARISTSRGQMTLELDCPEAPLNCLSFLQLATQGFYDGLPVHRMVPGFLVQTGDPRGDGLGGPGYLLRDEIHPARFGRGTVGMARSEPDAAGSQFFITLSRQPHLDGRYTVLGRVIQGLEVLDQLVQGDLVTAVTVLP